MDIETIRDYCIRKKGTTEEFPFDNVSIQSHGENVCLHRIGQPGMAIFKM